MSNITLLTTTNFDVVCELYVNSEYNVIIAAICVLLASFGLVYTYFGYRCFKGVMFLSGLIFGGTTSYLLCREERIFQQTVSLEIAAGLSVGIGILCGLITMLVRYVGLFLQGFFLGLLLAFAGILALQSFYFPSTAWIPAGILFGTGIICSVLTLKFQKQMVIFSTAVFGSILITACVDYFVEDFLLMWYAWEALMANPTVTLCWYTWLILSLWPSLSISGIFLQWKITSKGYDHTDVIIPRGRRKQVRTHLVRTHQRPRGTVASRRLPPARSVSASAPSGGSATRRVEPRQAPSTHHHRERGNPVPIDTHQMRVEIDPTEDPPSYFECVELGAGEPLRRSAHQSGALSNTQMHGRMRNNPGQQSFSGQSYASGSNPQPHRGYVVNAQARSAQQGQPRSSNSNRNHEPIDQFSRRQRHANLPQRRNNRVSDANRYRVSLSTSARAREDRSDTQRLLPDPQRAGSSREAMAVLAQFVQGVEDRRSSGQLLSTTQSPSHPY